MKIIKKPILDSLQNTILSLNLKCFILSYADHHIEAQNCTNSAQMTK